FSRQWGSFGNGIEFDWRPPAIIRVIDLFAGAFVDDGLGPGAAMSKMMNSIFSIREYRGKNRRLGSVLATALVLYIGAVIAFIIAY
ncbi:MAG TPA: hypothetical protein VF089_03245, partial [Candidatus Binatia bacterium]